MSVRSTPEGTGRPAAYETYGDDDRGYGWVAFAGVLLLVVWTFGARAWRGAVTAVTATAIVVCCLAMTSRLAPDLLPSTLEQTGYAGYQDTDGRPGA